MSVRFPFVVLMSVAVLSFGLLIGCGPTGEGGDQQGAAESGSDGQDGDEVDPHDVPLTDEQKQQLRAETAKFADAVAKVKELRDAVERETKDGLPENPFEAHQALDKADFLLPLLPEVARNSGIATEHWETVNTAASELREHFDTVHLNIDNKVDPGFTSVQPQVDAKIAELEAIAQ
jgi:hypothetical protein